MSSPSIETERKFLIQYPNTESLSREPGVRTLQIRQTYLRAAEGVTARVRRIEEEGNIFFVKTEKRRINAFSAYENEWEIEESEYEAELENAVSDSRTIEKTRYKIPFGGFICEVDIYPFWRDRAILEIELPDQGAEAPIPPYLTVIRDVTEDVRYKNSSLAKRIPDM